MICISSSWIRYVKNINLFFNIYIKYPNLKKIIIGKQNPDYNFNEIPNTKVIDFIDFHVKNIHWPAFNFADICITCGIVIVLFSGNIVSKDN